MHCSSAYQYKLVRYSLLINNINWLNERLGFLKRVFFTLLLLYALYSNNLDVICNLSTSLAFLQQENVKKSKKLVNVVNIEEENLLNELRNSNEIFRKDVTYDNIKSHKRADLHPFSKKHIFGRTASGKRRG